MNPDKDGTLDLIAKKIEKKLMITLKTIRVDWKKFMMQNTMNLSKH